jgi:hypothetical protein
LKVFASVGIEQERGRVEVVRRNYVKCLPP